MKEYLGEDALSFFKEQKLGVFSSIDAEGNPHGAAVYYVVGDDGSFYFISPAETQKSLNIEKENKVAFTVTNEKKMMTGQLKGIATKEEDLVLEILEKLAKKLSDKTPEMMGRLPLFDFKNQGKTVVRIRPEEMIVREFTEALVEEKFSS